ncbi:tetrahydrofolate dehydrogenase/cyclohydrolase catalytic domain-containing protein [Elusimicrobiota bacterium]
MDTVHMDCKRLARSYFGWVRERMAELGYAPGVATVCLKRGAVPGSLEYRDLILKDAARLGVRSESVEVADEPELLAELERLNSEPDIHGVIVLYPLGFSRPDVEFMDLISPAKDIEGLHSINLGYLIKYRKFLDRDAGIKCVVPATAKAVVKTLQHHLEDRIPGSFVVIVNNSMRVGNPLGVMLENLGATVVKCYDRTRPEVLEHCVRRADILVTAVPDPAFSLDPGWVRDGAAVIDVSFVGNVDVGRLEGRAALLSAPDSRIGKMTRAMMFVNLIYCCRPGGLDSELRPDRVPVAARRP